MCVEYGRDWVLFSRLRPGRVGGGGIAASTLFQQADVGKIPANSKTLNCKHDQRIADRPTAGIEALPHYHQLLVVVVGVAVLGVLHVAVVAVTDC